MKIDDRKNLVAFLSAAHAKLYDIMDDPDMFLARIIHGSA
jgi:hypothetical protein